MFYYIPLQSSLTINYQYLNNVLLKNNDIMLYCNNLYGNFYVENITNIKILYTTNQKCIIHTTNAIDSFDIKEMLSESLYIQVEQLYILNTDGDVLRYICPSTFKKVTMEGHFHHLPKTLTDLKNFIKSISTNTGFLIAYYDSSEFTLDDDILQYIENSGYNIQLQSI